MKKIRMSILYIYVAQVIILCLFFLLSNLFNIRSGMAIFIVIMIDMLICSGVFSRTVRKNLESISLEEHQKLFNVSSAFYYGNPYWFVFAFAMKVSDSPNLKRVRLYTCFFLLLPVVLFAEFIFVMIVL